MWGRLRQKLSRQWKYLYFAQEETLRLKRIAAASEKPHDTPSYSSTTVTAVSLLHFWSNTILASILLCTGWTPDRGATNYPHLRGPNYPCPWGDARKVLPLRHQQVQNHIHPLENLRHGPLILFQTFQLGQWYFEKDCHCKSDIFVNPWRTWVGYEDNVQTFICLLVINICVWYK